MVEVDVRLTLQDYLLASYLVLFRRLWWFLMILMLSYPAVYFTAPAGSLRLTTDPGSLRIFFPAALLIFVLIGTFLAARRNLKRHAALQGEIRYSFSRDGISAAGSVSSGQTGWKGVGDAFETKRSFLIFISKNVLYVIPKRCFREGEDVIRLRRLLAEMLGRKARVRKSG